MNRILPLSPFVLVLAILNGCATFTNIELGGAGFPEEGEETLRDLAYSGTRVKISDTEGNQSEGTILEFSQEGLALEPSIESGEDAIVFRWADISRIEAKKAGPSPLLGFFVIALTVLVIALATGLVDPSIEGN